MAYQAELARIQRNAQSAEARLAAAQEARQGENTRIAGRLLRGLVSDRNAPEVYRTAARTALGEMREEAEQRMAELEQHLANADVARPPSADRIEAEVLEILDKLDAEDHSRISHGEVASSEPSDSEAVSATFAKMDALIWQYETVPGVATGLRRRLGRLRRDERYAGILNEPEAATLWEQGQRHEQAQELCCAYVAYERAARLAPARSATRAERRLRQLSKEPGIEASVERCRKLHRCHEWYQLGALLAKAGSLERARMLFEQVVDAAPPDSTVHAAALQELQRLGSDT